MKQTNKSSKLLVVADQVVVSGGNFLLGLVLIKTLGLREYGLFAMLWLVVLLALSLHQSFITKPLMTLAIQEFSDALTNYFNKLWLWQIKYGLLGMLPITGIAFICHFWGYHDEWIAYAPIIALISVVYLLQDFLKKVYFLQKEYTRPLLMDLICYAGLFTGLFLLESIGRSNLGNTLFLLLAVYTISVIMGCKPFFKKDTQTRKLSTTIILKKHYHFSNWLLGTSILQWLSGNVYLITAASILGTTAVGALRMAQNIVGLCHLLFLAMENIVPSEAAQHFSLQGQKKLLQYLKSISLKMGALTLLLLAGLSLIAPLLIQWFYGEHFKAYSYVVWGYSLLYVFVFLGFPIRYFFRTLQFTKPIFIAYSVSTLFSLSAAFYLVNAYGISGVIIGLILSQIVSLLVYVYYLLLALSERKHVVNSST